MNKKETALAVARMVGHDAGLAKRLGEIGGSLQIIFYNQYLHRDRPYSRFTGH